MRVVSISDTHGLHNSMKYKIPFGDLLIIAGDFTNIGQKEDLLGFVKWINGIKKFQYKILVSGNHDWCFERKEPWLNQAIDELSKNNSFYLEDTSIELSFPEFSRPLKVYGTPWTPRFHDWAFNVDRDKIYVHWEKIPLDTDILVTHGPPANILDRTVYGNDQGCVPLKDFVENKIRPALHVFGHIHEASGVVETPNTLFVNASICNRKYYPIHMPISVDIFQDDTGRIIAKPVTTI